MAWTPLKRNGLGTTIPSKQSLLESLNPSLLLHPYPLMKRAGTCSLLTHPQFWSPEFSPPGQELGSSIFGSWFIEFYSAVSYLAKTAFPQHFVQDKIFDV